MDNFNIGDNVKILTPFAKVILGSDKGTVTDFKGKSFVVQVEGRHTKLVYKPNEIEKINNF